MALLLIQKQTEQPVSPLLYSGSSPDFSLCLKGCLILAGQEN